MSMRPLVMRHVGRSGVVIGGGPSASWAFVPFFGGNVPRNAVICSANEHGHLWAGFPPVDYSVACDNIEDRLRQYPAPIIGPRRTVDFRVFDPPVNISGGLAAWALWVMGCSPIILTGCDCYEADTYFWDPNAESSGQSRSIERHVQRWLDLAEMSPGIMLRPVAGPLTEVFPVYDPLEPPIPVPLSKSDMLSRAGGVRVRFVRPVPSWHHRSFAVGDQIDLRSNEANYFICSQMAVPIYESDDSAAV